MLTLTWKREIKWWPKHGYEHHDKVTYGDDLSPANDGYDLKEIRDTTSLGHTFIEVEFHPHISDDCPQSCGFSILHNPDTDGEECIDEEGFE